MLTEELGCWHVLASLNTNGTWPGPLFSLSSDPILPASSLTFFSKASLLASIPLGLAPSMALQSPPQSLLPSRPTHIDINGGFGCL